MKKISIIGSGTWGTALAHHLAGAGHDVYLFSHFYEEAEELRATNVHKNLPLARLHSAIHFCFDEKNEIPTSDIVILAVPSSYMRNTTKEYKNLLNTKQIIVNVAKGIEKDTLFTMSEVIKDELGDDYHVVTLSGPSHAEEVALDLPTCITAASENEGDSKIIQQEFSFGQFRVYTNKDWKGVEIAGSLKNIIALACGLSDGLGFGDNAKAAIMTRGLFEITKIGLALGCDPFTFVGLSGVGDVIVTSTSLHSRNYRAGNMLGKGYPLRIVLEKVGMVVEGINCLDSAKQLVDKYKINAPIINMMYQTVKEGKSPAEGVKNIFARDLVDENKIH